MALHQNPAAIIATGLQLDRPISSKVLQETQSALRLLKIKTPIGSLGKQDNDLKRACALLEYIVREREGFKIPMNRLARAACMKERDFQKFHELVGNFRGSFASAQSNQTSRLLKLGGKQIRKFHSNQSSIPSLAIKLGSYVQDSNGVSIAAIKLFERIERHTQNMAASERGYQLRDMKEHQKSYEAACFYLAATSDKFVKSHKRIQNDDDDNKQLQVADILNCSTDFTSAEFKNILDHVQNLCKESQNMRREKLQHKSSKAQKSTAGDCRKRQQQQTATTLLAARLPSSRTKSSGLWSQELASNATFDLLQKAVTHQDQDIIDYEESSNQQKRQKFVEWKRIVIRMAMEKARKQRDDDNEDISDEEAVDLGVKQVLKSHGFGLA
jgi:hypothetical protein